jgi:hypothetical protein
MLISMCYSSGIDGNFLLKSLGATSTWLEICFVHPPIHRVAHNTRFVPTTNLYPECNVMARIQFARFSVICEEASQNVIMLIFSIICSTVNFLHLSSDKYIFMKSLHKTLVPRSIYFFESTP